MKGMYEHGEGQPLLPLAFGGGGSGSSSGHNEDGSFGKYHRSRSHNDIGMMFQSERSVLTPPQEEEMMPTNNDNDDTTGAVHDGGGGRRIIGVALMVASVLLVALISFHSWILTEMNDGRTSPTTLTVVDAALLTNQEVDVFTMEEEEGGHKKKKKEEEKKKKKEKEEEKKEKKKKKDDDDDDVALHFDDYVTVADIEEEEDEVEEEGYDTEVEDVDVEVEPDNEEVVAYVNLMRHGEKDENSGEGLSQLGEDRAEYYARCIAGNTGMDGGEAEEAAERQTIPSLSFPMPVGALYSQLNTTVSPAYKGNVGLSHRSKDTLVPLSYATGLEIVTPCTMTDMDCFAETVTPLITANTVTLVTWEHKLFPILLKNLLLKGGSYAASLLLDGGLSKVAEHVDGFTELMEQNDNRWPQACDAAAFQNPRIVKPGKEKEWDGEDFPYHGACFDIVWQIKYIEKTGKKSGVTWWKPVSVEQLQNGFGGVPNTPCAEGLTPL